MKIVIISPKNRTVYNFRGDLVKELVGKGYDVLVTGPNLDEVEKITELGARFKQIPLNKTGLNVVEDMKYLMYLSSLLKSEKPDVTLGYTIKPVIYGSIAAKIARVKNVNSMITGVGYAFTASSKKARVVKFFASILYRIALKCSDTVIFQNEDDMNEFVNSKIVSQDKCCLVNGSGVNMEKYKPADFPEKLTFFMLSRVMYSKGIEEYLIAASKIKKKYPDVQFMLLGAIEDTPDSMTAEKLKSYIDNGIVDYMGETDDVSQYYKKCSVYVLPSYREGTPRTVLEAMAMARPIITTDAPGCRETVVDTINGFLIPVKDSTSLADKMEWYVKNQNEIVNMGRASYQYCAEKFEVSKVNKSMLEYMKIT